MFIVPLSERLRLRAPVPAVPVVGPEAPVNKFVLLFWRLRPNVIGGNRPVLPSLFGDTPSFSCRSLSLSLSCLSLVRSLSLSLELFLLSATRCDRKEEQEKEEGILASGELCALPDWL